ncbi:MAG: ABC transporter substrate-binding protein [Candidatus Rokubacteria bacterium]|nr:ABC transporter substrate-binding protein [Candidatus Rokubacteria bacterium]
MWPTRFWSSMLALAVCASAAAVPAPAPAQAFEPVTVQLKWHHQTQFAGLYVAEHRGLYQAERLAVQHAPWKVGMPSPIDQVAAGRATFGITSQTEFLLARERGVPVVAIAAVYQRSPVGFFVLKRSGIRHPREFAGKAVAYAPTHEIHLKAMLKRLDVDPAALRRVPYSFDLGPFYRGEVPVWAGYVMNQPVDARLAGHEVTVFFPSDYGVYGYDDIIVAAEELVRRNPRLIERWLRAALRGWRVAIERPDEATDVALKVDPALRRDKQLAMLLASIPLIHTGEHPIGWMTREMWEEAMGILLEQKILSRPVDLSRAYSTAFLEQVWGTQAQTR